MGPFASKCGETNPTKHAQTMSCRGSQSPYSYHHQAIQDVRKRLLLRCFLLLRGLPRPQINNLSLPLGQSKEIS
ncbi:hypothetical protein DL546_008416 [Coniochaeta pulveracea]|uniref:Uncharacterized protein n=1 Tax=Coniochaeta pulveracea TaxID=177199 RepID=A0A420YIY5_9PEZI|nr:hypothetical protein DL546_008416 [Coniochaeta pulveracea]